MTPLYFFLGLLAAYLLGSISFAIVVTRVMGIADPRRYGSGNPGATNVLRSGNKWAAALTLLGDALKGWVAVSGAQWVVLRFSTQSDVGAWWVPLIALAVFLGHVYPVYHGFRGGKGVATALGVMLGLSVWLGLATLCTWMLIAFFFRYSSLASIVAALFGSFYNVLLFGVDEQALSVFVISALVIYRHGDNIGKLLQGKESRIGAPKK